MTSSASSVRTERNGKRCERPYGEILWRRPLSVRRGGPGQVWGVRGAGEGAGRGTRRTGWRRRCTVATPARCRCTSNTSRRWLPCPLLTPAANALPCSTPHGSKHGLTLHGLKVSIRLWRRFVVTFRGWQCHSSSVLCLCRSYLIWAGNFTTLFRACQSRLKDFLSSQDLFACRL